MANEENLIPKKKGNPGSKGRPKDPPELHLIKKLTKGEFDLLMNRLLILTPAQAEIYQGNILEMAMLSILKKAVDHGDHFRLQFFIDRLLGKVVDKMEVSEKPSLMAKVNRFKKFGKG